eukprot:jgi/Mesvir1/19633/Mv09919-RA.1
MAYAAGISCWSQHYVHLKIPGCTHFVAKSLSVRDRSPIKSVWLGNPSQISLSVPRLSNASQSGRQQNIAVQTYAKWNPFGGGKWLGGPELIERNEGVLVDVEELRALLHSAHPPSEGGCVYESDRVKKLLYNSLAVVALYMKEDGKGANGSTGAREKLVACAWAHGDAGLTGTISHVVVHPDHQRQGMGSRVVKRLLRELRQIQVEDIGLVTEPQFVPFFKANGFEDDRMGSTVMTYARGREPPPPLTLPLKFKWPAF